MKNYVVLMRAPKKCLKEPIINLANKICNSVKLEKNVVIHIKKIDAEKSEDTLLVGEYSDYDNEYKEHVITINSIMTKKLNDFSIEQLFRTICHELYHCFQNESRVFISESRAEKFEEKCMKKFFDDFKNSIEC